HPYSEVEKRRGGDRAVPENDRPAALRTAAGPGSVPVAARGHVRRGATAQLSGPAARRPPLCLRIPPHKLAGGGGVCASARAQCVIMRGGVSVTGGARRDDGRPRVLPAGR